MQTTLTFIQDDRTTLHLYCYADFHRYEMTYTIAIVRDGKYTEKTFKHFNRACQWFNTYCETIDKKEWIIW